MRKRSGLLEKLYYVPEYSESYKKLLNMIYKYYFISDLIDCSNKHIIFEQLYIVKKNNIQTYMQNNVSASTLTRYIKNFEDLAIVIINYSEDLSDLKKFIQK